MEAKQTKDETSNLLSVEQKSPYYSNAQEYQDVNYGNLYQPILNESQGRPFQQDFNYYPPSIQDCQPDPAPAEQPPNYHNHINPNPYEYYQPLPAEQQKFNAQPIPAMQNPVVATRRNQSFDIRIIASICMIVLALLLSNFVLLLCIVPSIYCIYKGNTERDEEEKKKYTRLALCSSFCLIIASFFCFISLDWSCNSCCSLRLMMK
ncbi:PREDICTED: uncharacterized protein LOC109583596 [Amphimedon queenslandica]|uniref:Uncharacterized protein n=1 Tax=Amphimedon queenslandica TaxID=400682 RepID=A0A1X7UGC3_AMPQE|nr:PREDICTED: uncharacterized protein LOC109583596 [Amphimedon queenslandica]|eukprot:XP_019854573.1 PREDICTED: uncharacterized protein LOC109583596 [Amphimedon queenslandica]